MRMIDEKIARKILFIKINLYICETNSQRKHCPTNVGLFFYTNAKDKIMATSSVTQEGLDKMKVELEQLETIETVSYTHLDVYKRQNQYQYRRNSAFPAYANIFGFG